MQLQRGRQPLLAASEGSRWRSNQYPPGWVAAWTRSRWTTRPRSSTTSAWATSRCAPPPPSTAQRSARPSSVKNISKQNLISRGVSDRLLVVFAGQPLGSRGSVHCYCGGGVVASDGQVAGGCGVPRAVALRAGGRGADRDAADAELRAVYGGAGGRQQGAAGHHRAGRQVVRWPADWGVSAPPLLLPRPHTTT